MAIYCISDIHGYYDKFIEMLDLINFQETDHLYVLGDIIDRGPQSAEMLWFATKEAPKNFHFLLGNHEDMMLAAANNYYDRDFIELRMYDSWSYNHGMETIDQIRFFDKYYDGWERRILDWVDCLPFYYDIVVDGRRFILVHAALQSRPQWPDDCCDEGKNHYVEIAGAPCPQNVQALLWNRTSWLTDVYRWPFDVITGHTPTKTINLSLLGKCGIEYVQEKSNGILHFGSSGCRKHLIDCGVNKDGYLACLRLDDMEEFYVGGECYTKILHK